MQNAVIRKADAPSLETALDDAHRNLSNLRSQSGGDEAARLRKIVNQEAVVRSFERLIRHAQKAEN